MVCVAYKYGIYVMCVDATNRARRRGASRVATTMRAVDVVVARVVVVVATRAASVVARDA